MKKYNTIHTVRAYHFYMRPKEFTMYLLKSNDCKELDIDLTAGLMYNDECEIQELLFETKVNSVKDILEFMKDRGVTYPEHLIVDGKLKMGNGEFYLLPNLDVQIIY